MVENGAANGHLTSPDWNSSRRIQRWTVERYDDDEGLIIRIEDNENLNLEDESICDLIYMTFLIACVFLSLFTMSWCLFKGMRERIVFFSCIIGVGIFVMTDFQFIPFGGAFALEITVAEWQPPVFPEQDLEASISSASLPALNRQPRYIQDDEPRNQVYNIGAVLSDGDSIVFFNHVTETVGPLPANVKFHAASIYMNPNPIRTAQAVCEKIISAQVYTVIVSHPTSGEVSPAAVSYTCGFYNIPVIGISNRDSSLSNKNLHGSFMRTIPPYSHQADVWIEILKYLEYKSVVFIHSSDADGLATVGRFQNGAEAAKVHLEMVIEYDSAAIDSDAQLATNLDRAKQELFCRVFVLSTSKEDAEHVFSVAEQMNMTGAGYIWIGSEQALDAVNRPEGFIAVRLNKSDENAHIEDSIKIIAGAFLTMFYREKITRPPNDCASLATAKWESGIKFYQYLINQSIPWGKTGRIAFDENGDRLFSDYEIINVQAIVPKRSEVNDDSHLANMVVGHYTFSKSLYRMNLELNLDEIIWPGKMMEKPPFLVVPRHLNIVTIEEKPFILAKDLIRIPRPGSTMKKMKEELVGCRRGQIPCTRNNISTGIEERYCCEGYCIDMLARLAEKVNFTFDLYLVSDGLYGTQDWVYNGSSYVKQWNGMIADIISKKADMVVAPLTISPERSLVMDFSKPFKYQGITILQRRSPRKDTLDSFLQPFRHELWVLVGVAVHVVALALYVLDKFSPFARFKAPSPTKDEPPLNLSSSIYFAWSVLLNSGIGERTPKSFAGRVLGMVWAGFAMIVVASYTANLAAFLVLDQRDDYALSGIDDRRLRNPADSFRFATVKGSYVDNYFRRQVQYLNVHRNMEENNLGSAEEAIQALKKEELDAFIWDSPRLEYEAAKDCELITSGELFGRSGYGVGLQKNSYWTADVTLAVLGMHESGYMESLDNKWILKGADVCAEKNAALATKTLGLHNMAGVFILVFTGILTGFGLIIMEIIYKRRRAKKLRKNATLRKMALKWRHQVQKRKLSGASRYYGRNSDGFARYQWSNQVPITKQSADSKKFNILYPVPQNVSVNQAMPQGPRRMKPNGMEGVPFTISKGGGPPMMPSGFATLPRKSSGGPQSGRSGVYSSDYGVYPQTNFMPPGPEERVNRYLAQCEMEGIPPPPPPPSTSPSVAKMRAMTMAQQQGAHPMMPMRGTQMAQGAANRKRSGFDYVM